MGRGRPCGRWFQHATVRCRRAGDADNESIPKSPATWEPLREGKAEWYRLARF